MITSFSERDDHLSTNLSNKTIGFGNMRVSNCNQLATNIVTIDNSLTHIAQNIAKTCQKYFQSFTATL